MGRYDTILRYIRGRIRIPDEVINRDEPILLHISDTPRVIFNSLAEMIDIIQPEYIIHTGDLVDNLKLELFPNLALQYQKKVKKIIKIIKCSKVMSYIALGNHDQMEVENFADDKLHVSQNKTKVMIEGLTIAFNHRYVSGNETDFFLYGHDETISDQANELNGIKKIYVIFLHSKKIIEMDYPWGTDEQRMRITSIGM
jgi:predicted phosphodiesterase